MKTVPFYSVCLLALWLFNTSARATPPTVPPLDVQIKDEGDATVDPYVYYAGEVVVTGRRIANIEQAATTTVIEREDIERHGDKTVDQSLARIPGIVTYTHTKGHTRLRMRGFDQDKVAVLIDGVPISDVYSTDVDLSSIPVIGVAKIVVNSGVSSALYGTDGAVGSINIITRKPERPYVRALGEWGQWGNHTLHLEHGASLNKWYYLVGVTQQNSNGFAPSKKLDAQLRRMWLDKTVRYTLFPVAGPFDTGVVHTFDDVTTPAIHQYLRDQGKWNHSEYEKTFLHTKVGVRFTPRLEGGVAFSLAASKGKSNTYELNAYSQYRGDAWKPRWPYFGNEVEETKKFALRNRSFVWPQATRIEVSPYLRMVVGDFSAKLNLFHLRQSSLQQGYASNDHVYTKGESVLHKGHNIYEPFDDLKTFTSSGVRFIPSYAFSRNHRLSLGIHFRHDTYFGEERAVSARVSPQTYTRMGAQAYPCEDLRSQTLSVGIEDEFRLWRRLKVAVGGSYDMQHFSHFEQRTNERYESRYIVNDDAVLFGTRDSFNPVVGTVFDVIRQRLRLRAAGTMKSRFPTLGEFAKVEAADLDRQLKAERSYNVNGGAELFFWDKKISVRSDYFMSFITNRIVKIGKGEPPANMDEMRVHGVESMLTANFGDAPNRGGAVSFSAGHTWLHARYAHYKDDSTINKGPFVEFVPEHDITLDVQWALPSQTSLSVWMTFNAKQRIYVMGHRPTEIDAPYSTDYFDTVFLHNPVFLNARVSQRFFEHYDFSFTVTNLLDDYDADPFNPGPGRSVSLSLGTTWE